MSLPISRTCSRSTQASVSNSRGLSTDAARQSFERLGRRIATISPDLASTRLPFARFRGVRRAEPRASEHAQTRAALGNCRMTAREQAGDHVLVENRHPVCAARHGQIAAPAIFEQTLCAHAITSRKLTRRGPGSHLPAVRRGQCSGQVFVSSPERRGVSLRATRPTRAAGWRASRSLEGCVACSGLAHDPSGLAEARDSFRCSTIC